MLLLKGRAREINISASLKQALMALLFCSFAWTAGAATVTNAVSGDWSTGSTWVGGAVPIWSDDVVIVTNTTVTLSANVTQTGVVTIHAGGTLSDGGKTFGIKNNLNPGMVVNGTLQISIKNGLNKSGGGNNPTVQVNSGGLVEFSTTTATTGVNNWDVQPGSTILYSASGNQTIDNSITSFSNLTLSGSGTKTLASNTTVDGTLSMQGTATFALGGRTLTYGSNAVLEYKGSAAQTPSTAEFPTTMSAAVVIDNPSGVSFNTARTLNNNLTLLQGTFSLNAALTLGDGVTITRVGGSLSAAPTFGTTVNLLYTGNSGVTAGPEIPSSTTVLNNLTVNYTSSATLTLNAARTVNGLLTIGNSSTLADGGFALTAKANVANSGTQSGTGKLLLSGASSQTLSGAGSYGNVEVANASGVLLADTPTIQGALTLTTGKVATQSNQLNLGLTATVTRTDGWVNGKMQKAFGTGNNQLFTFPIGGNTYYRPVALSNLSVTTSGTLAANCSGSGMHHPQLNLSDINPSKDVIQWWTLTANTLVVTNYDATFTFDPSDIDGGGDPNNFFIRRWDGSAWFVTTVGNRTATSTQAKGLNTFSDFVIGEPLPTGVFITLPGQTFTSGIGNSGTVSNQVAGIPFTITLSAVTVLTNLDINYSGAKTINYIGPGISPNGFIPDYPNQVSFTNGQAILLSTTLKKVETTTISADDGSSLTNSLPSSPITILPGAVSASQSTVIADTTSLIANGTATSTITVTLTDNFGNPLSGKTVTLASSRGVADQISAASGSSSVSGMVTFTVSSIVAGSAIFTATDVTDGNVVLTQTATVTFQPDVLHHFAISPSPITGTYIAGTPITNITLIAQDANNNTVTSYSGPVTFGGTAGVVGSSANFVNGVRTGVSITPVVAGTNRTLTLVNATGKTGSTTISTILPATLDHYAVDFARPVYAGVPFSVTVTAKDTYDNITTNGLEGKQATLTTTIIGPVFTPNPITAWTNGQGSANTTFSLESTNLTISANDGTYSGTSELFDVVAQDGAYRTRASGNWDGTGTWEAYIGGSWTATNLPPTAASPSVLIKANHQVTVATTPSESLGRCHVDGTLIVATNATLSLAGLTEVHNLLLNEGTLNILGSATLLVQTPGTVLIDAENNVTPDGTTPYTVQGLLVNAGSLTNSGTLTVAPSGIYRHAVTNALVTIPAATWREDAICEITGLTGADGAPAGLNQRFQHLIWNCTNQSQRINLGSDFTNVVNFTIANTGSAKLTLGADLTVSNATVATSGGLSCGTNIIRGGSFALQANARFGIGSPDGITTNSASGNIQTSTRTYAAGARFCYDGSVAQVTGDGLPLPVAYLTITNNQGVAMTRDVNVAYLLELTSGSLTIGNHALIVRGTLVAQGGFLTGGTSSSLSLLDYNSPPATTLPGITNGLQHLVIDRASGVTLSGPVTIWETLTLNNGVVGGLNNMTLADGCLIIRDHGSFVGPNWPTPLGFINVELRAGDLTAGIAFPPGLGNVISNATLANLSGTVSLAYDFSIKGTLTLNPASRLNDNGKTVTVRGNLINNGTYVSTGRLILSNGSSQHQISGSGIFDKLEVDDSFGAILQNPTTVVKELKLTSGAVVNSTNLTLGTGVTIYRAAGSLDETPVFGATLNVQYVGGTSVTAGHELPSATNLLLNLTLNHTSAATLTLDASHWVNGNLFIGANSTLVDAGYTLTVVGHVTNHGVASGNGKISLDNPYSQLLYGSGVYGNLELVQGEVDLAGDPTINGTLTSINGKLVVLDHTLTLNGPSIQGAATNLQTTLNSGLIFGGSSSGVQIPRSVTLLKNLTINNSQGVTMNTNLTLVGTLTLSEGPLHAGSYVVDVQNTDNSCVSFVNGWVDGALQKAFVVGTNAPFIFCVGDATIRRPVRFSDMNVAVAGSARVQLCYGTHPEVMTSGVNTNKMLPFYWREISLDNFTISALKVTGSFTSGDVAAVVADSSWFVVRAWSVSTHRWFNQPILDRTTTNTTLSVYVPHLPGDNYSINEFVVGEPLASRLLVTLPGQTFTTSVGNSGTVSNQTARIAFPLTLTAVDLFNDVDRRFTGDKTLSYSGPGVGPDGGLPEYTTNVTFTSGQVTGVSTTLKKVETTTLTVTDGTLTGVASASLTVKPAIKIFTGPGNFSDSTKWSDNQIPLATDRLLINGFCSFDNAAANLAYGALVLGQDASATLSWPSGGTNTLNVSGVSSVVAGNALDMSNGGTLMIGSGGWDSTGETFTPGTGTLVWKNTTAASVLPIFTNYYNLTIDADLQSVSLTNAVTITGNLTLSSGTLDVTAANRGMNIKGNWNNNGGTFMPRAGTVTLNGTADQVIDGSTVTTFNNLTINNSGAAVTAQTNLNVSGTLTVTAGSSFIPAATAVLNGGAPTGTVTGAGSIHVTRTTAGADLVNQYRFTSYNLSSLAVAYSGVGDQTINNTLGDYSTLRLSGSGTKTLEGSVTNQQTFTIGSGVVFADNGATLTAKGPVTNDGTHSGAGSILLAGSVNQPLTGSGTYGNLTVANTQGATLNGSPLVTGTLALNAGLLTTDANSVKLASGAMATRISGWVNGTLEKAFAIGNDQAFTFPIGGVAYYRPVALTNLQVTTAGSLAAHVSSLAGNHPQIATSGLDSSKMVSRYWTLTTANGLVVGSSDATFNFNAADITGGADPANFDVRCWDGSAWSDTTEDVRTATSTSVTGLSSFGDIAIGESLASLMITTLPGQTFVSETGNTGTASNQVAGVPFLVTLTAVDVLTNKVSSFTGVKTIHYSGPTNAPNGATPLYQLAVSFTNGQAIDVPVTLKRAETTQLTATDDILTGVPSAALTVLSDGMSATQSEVTASPTSVIANGTSTSTITVKLTDSFGNPLSGRTVTLASSRGGTDQISAASGSSSASGMVTFTVSSIVAGPATFTATDVTDGDVVLTQTATVTFQPDVLHHFAISPSPITGAYTAGTPITGITLTAQDTNNNTVTSFQGTVTFGGTAGVTGNSANLVNGVRTGVSITPVVAGTNRTLTVINATGKTGSTTISTILPAALDHYAVDFARPVYAGVPFSVTVTAKDAYDNITTNGLEDKEAMLTTTKGVHTFTPNPIIAWTNGQGSAVNTFNNEATNLTISANDGTYSGTSEPFDVVALDGAYRTRASGDWDGASTWEAHISGVWTATNLPPTVASPSVLIKANHQVTVATTPSESLGRCHVDGTLIIATNATLSLAGLTEVHNLLLNEGTLNILGSAILLVQTPGTVLIDAENNVTPDGTTPYTVQGLLVNAGSLNNSGALTVAPSGIYRHAVTNASVAIPAATWREDAVCEITGLTGADGAPAGLDQRFQHLIWNCTNQTQRINLGSDFTNLVNFTIANTGVAKLKLDTDLTVSNATVVSSGGLSCGTNVIRGGSFTLQTNARFGIGSPDGITTNSASGNIQTATRVYTAGARFCYDGTVAQVTGDGLPSPLAYLTITNVQGVAMSKDLNVAYLLELNAGSLTIGSHTLTLRGELVTGGGFLTGGTNSILTILDYNSPTRAMLPGITNGLQHLTLDRASGATLGGLVRVWETILLQNGTLGGVTNLFLADGSLIIREQGAFQGPGSPNLDNIVNAELRGANLTAGVAFPPTIVNSVSNMTFANISGVIKLQYDLNLKGNLTIRYPTSRFDDNGTTLTVQGNVINNGTYVSSGRFILTGGSSQHVISGTGTFDRIEIDDTQGVILQNPTTVLRELVLTSGTLANSTNLTLGSGATIRRAAGALDGAPTFSGPVDVAYFGTTGVTAGYELPTTTNLLNNLTLGYSAAATLTLDASHRVNNDLTISTNATLADAGYTLTVAGDISNFGVAGGSGKIVLDNPASQVLFGSGSYGNLELAQGEADLAGDPVINGVLTLTSGPLQVLNRTLTLNGPSIQGGASNLLTTLNSGLVFGGNASGVQIPSNVVQLKNLTINNTNGVSLSNDLRVEGCLSLLQGVLDTGTKSVQLNNPLNDSNVLVRVDGWVNGILAKQFNAGAGQTCSFPIGGATAYRPVVFNSFDVLSSGMIQFRSVEAIAPEIAGSGLDSNRVVQAYWQGTALGRFQMVNALCSFYFANGDIPVGADASRFKIRAFASAANSWFDITVENSGTNYTQGSGIYTMAISTDDRYEYGNFVVGESLASQILVTLPSQTYTNTVEQGYFNMGTVSEQVAGTPFNLELRAVDPHNAVDASYTGEKTISYSGPSNGLNGSTPTYVTTVTFVNGVATALATTLKRAEITTITATDGVLPGVASAPLTVRNGAASLLAFTSPPITVTAGFNSGLLTVQRQDACGNPVTSNQTVTVDLISTSGGSVSFTPDPVQILSGASQASFTYWDNEVGSPWLTAQITGLMDATQQVSVVAPTTLIWDGGGADNQVLTVGNWQDSVLPREGDILAFAGATRLAVTNDLPAFTALSGISFLSDADAFILAGAPMTLSGPLSNHATVQQTLQLEVSLDTHVTVDVITNGVLELNGLVSGSYSLTKTNAGTLILTGTNTYSSGTTVEGGVLKVNNTTGSGTGSGAVSVHAGGTLGGNGTISGQTVIDAGGVLAPGYTAGTLNFLDNLVMQPSAVYQSELGVSSNQVVVVAGTAVINGTTLTVTGADLTATTYTLLRAGTLSGTFAGLPDGTLITVSSGLFYRIHYRSNEVILVCSQGGTFISFF
jgi:fibronectin-binding autotransporter adhesin